jgi:hypothetical protein
MLFYKGFDVDNTIVLVAWSGLLILRHQLIINSFIQANKKTISTIEMVIISCKKC